MDSRRQKGVSAPCRRAMSEPLSPGRLAALGRRRLREAGDLPGFDMRGWIDLLLPAGVPRNLRARLTAECQQVITSPEIKDRFLSIGIEPLNMTPVEFSDFLRRQSDNYATIARQANIKAE